VAKTKVISLAFFLVTFCRKNFWFSQAGFNGSFFCFVKSLLASCCVELKIYFSVLLR
jgi:hypothetical protein